MKTAMLLVGLLLLLSVFFAWRYFSREVRTEEGLGTQGIKETEISQTVDAAIEEEVNAAVEGISEADIEAALLGE